MARVICELDNASDTINGYAFTGEPGAKISEDIPDDIAATLATIPGFRLADPPGPPVTPDGGTDASGQSGGAGGEGDGDPTKGADPAKPSGKKKPQAEQPPAS